MYRIGSNSNRDAVQCLACAAESESESFGFLISVSVLPCGISAEINLCSVYLDFVVPYSLFLQLPLSVAGFA